MILQCILKTRYIVVKTLLIAQVNRYVRTEQKFICVSRPRRFGKSMAADMLSAYYSAGEDTSTLFEHLKISKDASYNWQSTLALQKMRYMNYVWNTR